MVSAKVARSSRNGQAAAPAEDGPVTIKGDGFESSNVGVTARPYGGVAVTFWDEEGKFQGVIVEAGRPVKGNATYLVRVPRKWSVRLHEVAFHSEYDEDDTCTCATQHRYGQCRHLAIIRHLLHTEQLPD